MLSQCTVLGDISLDRFIILDAPIYPSPFNPGNFILPLELGQKIIVKDSQEMLGGNAYNISLGLALMGIKPTLLTVIGTDEISQKALAEIQKTEIISNRIVSNAQSSINSSTILSVASQRVVLSNHAPKDYTALGRPESEWVYLTSLSQGGEHHIQEEILTKFGGKIAFNPGSYLMAHHIHLIQTLLAKTSLLFVNKEEAQHITNSPDEEYIPHLIQSLHRFGVPIICLTDGINGAYLSDQEKILYAPSRIVSIKETTGAGDALAGAFLAAYLQGQPLEIALKWGIIQSSCVIQAIGSAKGLASRTEVETLSPSIQIELL